MIIVLDANILYQSHLKSADFRTLLDFVSSSDETFLAIPQVVCDECMNLCRKEVEKIQEALGKTFKDLRHWTNLPSPLTNTKVQDIIAQYNQAFEAILKAPNVSVLAYPDTPHHVLVAKCLAGKKPFSENGKDGYRDALVWESILDLLGSSSEGVIFITNNTRDFFEKEALHPHLREDLQQRAIAPERVAVYKDLASFIDQYVKPTLQAYDRAKAEKILDEFSIGDHSPEDVQSILLDALRSSPFPDDIDPHEVGLPSEVETIRLTFVEHIAELRATDAKSLSSGEWLIEAEGIAECVFDFFLFKADWYPIEELHPSIMVIDDDWNDHYIAASTTTTVRISFSMTFDERQGEVTSLEVRSMAPVIPSL